MFVPRHENSDAGNSDMPQRSLKVLPLREKVKVVNLKNEKKYCMLILLRSTVKTNLSMKS